MPISDGYETGKMIYDLFNKENILGYEESKIC